MVPRTLEKYGSFLFFILFLSGALGFVMAPAYRVIGAWAGALQRLVAGMSAEPGAYRVALPEFEGPLDLLLHLCKTHEIDIVNIPIAFITEKYLEYLDVMQSMPFDVAADYLVMAATLAYLKSRELVPTPEPLEAVGDEEDGEVLDPREELIRRLLEYQKYKDAAEQLGGRPIEGRTVFGRGVPLESAAEAPMTEQSVWKLIEAFGRILEKSGGPKRTHDVIVDRAVDRRSHDAAARPDRGGAGVVPLRVLLRPGAARAGAAPPGRGDAAGDPRAGQAEGHSRAAVAGRRDAVHHAGERRLDGGRAPGARSAMSSDVSPARRRRRRPRTDARRRRRAAGAAQPSSREQAASRPERAATSGEE